MGGDDEEHSGEDNSWSVTRGWSVSRGQSVSTAAGTRSVMVTHIEGQTESCYHEAGETVGVRLTRTIDEDSGEIRRILLTELVRLLADAPEAVTLDGVAANAKDFLFTLRLPRALLAEVVGTAGTSEAPYLVLTRKSGASEA